MNENLLLISDKEIEEEIREDLRKVLRTLPNLQSLYLHSYD